MEVSLKYTDEDDKCYGLVGTAVGMLIYECDDRLQALCMDEEDPDKTIRLVPESLVQGNPQLSAKVVWSSLLKQYEMMIGMTVSNYLCRTLVLHSSSVDPFAKNMLRRVIMEEGHESCQLDDDEIDAMFDKGYNYLYKVFSHSAVKNVVHTFASSLKTSRIMERDEIERQLVSLKML